jgi:hypothetical protein
VVLSISPDDVECRLTVSTDGVVLFEMLFDDSVQWYCLVIVLTNAARRSILRRSASRAEYGVQVPAHLKKAHVSF